MANRPAVFLDRDGVINPLIYYPDHGLVDSPFTLEQFRIFPNVPKAIRLFNDLGFTVIVASNQPGVAKGHFNEELLEKIEAKLQNRLNAAGAHIDDFYYCLHHPQAVKRKLRKHCACRKPGANLLRKAARDLDISLPNSYMIGDGLTDIEAGIRAGCKTIFVGGWKPEHFQFMRGPAYQPDYVVSDLWQAARLIQRQCEQESAPGAQNSTKASLPATPTKYMAGKAAS